MISKSSSSSVQQWVGRLPIAFIGTAFVNFIVGAILGGWMAVVPSVSVVAGPIHGEINPFGWLTFMIYGMTYAVLTLSAGIRPPKAWVGWLHWVLAECALILVVAALLAGDATLYVTGLAAQFAAPILFLVNILSAVFSARRQRAKADTPDAGNDLASASPNGALAALAALGRHPALRDSDRIAQRGTDLALLAFLVGTGWMLIDATVQVATRPPAATMLPVAPQGALFLIYYGWIAGTILAVSLHLFPRFFTSANLSPNLLRIGQAVWGVALIAGGLRVVDPSFLIAVANRMLAIALVLYAIMYLYAMTARSRNRAVAPAAPTLPFPLVSRIAWVASFAYSLALGVCLLVTGYGLSLASMHLLFLGFATTLVYGVGYTMFPLLLRRTVRSGILPFVQLVLSIVGTSLMIAAFLNLSSVDNVDGAFLWLAIGGSCAAVGAILFIVQWPFAKSQQG